MQETKGLVRRIAGPVSRFGEAALELGHLFRCTFMRMGRAGRERYLLQLYTVGAGSAALVAVAAFFSGMVISLQAAVELTRFGAAPLVAGIVTVTFVRELGPVFAGLLLAGKAGSGIAAEFGGLLLSDQLRAMRALSIDFERVVLAPTMRATVLSVLLLVVLADVAGILGGLVLVSINFGLSPVVFLNESIRALEWTDLVSGLGKSVGFGFIIALSGAYFGLRPKRSAEDLGRDTMKAVVSGSFCVLVSDHLMTRAFVALLGE